MFFIDSALMTIYPSQEKVGKIIRRYKKLLKAEKVNIVEIRSVLDLLTSTYQTVLPALL